MVSPAVKGRRQRATAVIGTHFVIDAFSFMIIAMIPSLVVMLNIPTHQKALLLGIGSVSSGLIQPVVACCKLQRGRTARAGDLE